MTPPSVRRAVFIRTDRLGETLLTLPAVSALRAAFPAASVTLLVHPDLQPLLEGSPGIERVAALPSPRAAWWVRAWQVGRTLRAGRFDLAVVSNPKKELHLAVWLAGIPIRVGYDRKWGGLLTHRVPDRKALGERHEVEYNVALLSPLGVSAPGPAWSFPQFSREEHEVHALLAREGLPPSASFIAVHPWSSTALKEWPAERYRTLLQRLADELKVRVVLVGGPEVRGRVPTVQPVPRPAVELVGRLSLRQLAALLQRADLLVSNDSGPVHLAAAVGTPTVVLFGSPDAAAAPGRWGPWGGGHTVIWKASMEAIEVDEVFEAVRRRLGS